MPLYYTPTQTHTVLLFPFSPLCFSSYLLCLRLYLCDWLMTLFQMARLLWCVCVCVLARFEKDLSSSSFSDKEISPVSTAVHLLPLFHRVSINPNVVLHGSALARALPHRSIYSRFLNLSLFCNGFFSYSHILFPLTLILAFSSHSLTGLLSCLLPSAPSLFSPIFSISLLFLSFFSFSVSVPLPSPLYPQSLVFSLLCNRE